MAFTYICFIPKVSESTTLRISAEEWETFARSLETRYPVAVTVLDFETDPLPAGLRTWVVRATSRAQQPTVLNRRMTLEMSREIDAFIEPRRQPLPQAA